MRNASRRSLAAFLVVLASAAPVLAGGRVAGGKALFTADSYMEHVRYLASDALEGRGTGYPGNDKAAEYIAERFHEFGLKPAGVDGTYFQSFDVKPGKKLTEAEALLQIVGDERAWALKKEWTPLPTTKAGAFEGPLAFAGYGIEAAEFEYNDYAGFDARDKVLLVFRYEPKSDDAKAKFGGTDPSRHALFATKASVAARKGAAGLIIVNPPDRETDDKLYAFAERGTRETHDLPEVHVSRAVAAALLAKAGMPTLEELNTKLVQDRKSLSQDLKGVSVKCNTGVNTTTLKTRNVIGLLPGAGNSGEMIVVGAHYDHLGIASRSFRMSDGPKSIHNGADDNASGTSGIIEMARVAAGEPNRKRDILFIAFSGEELGLLGSRHFVDNPTIDLTKVRAMLNFDMIGRFAEDRLLIYGIPTAEVFKSLVQKAADEAGLPYKSARTLPGNSDHASFQRKKIPVLFPFTGIHKNYHQPEDDWELIRPEGATRILDMFYSILIDLSNLDDGPTWVDSKKKDEKEDEAVAALESPERTADDPNSKAANAHAAAEADDGAPRMPRIRLGVIPDYSDEGPGMRIEGVADGGVAQKAGLKEGDRIVKLNEFDVKDVYSYMSAMGNFKAGQQIEIIVEREGKRQTLSATLTASERPAKD